MQDGQASGKLKDLQGDVRNVGRAAGDARGPVERLGGKLSGLGKTIGAGMGIAAGMAGFAGLSSAIGGALSSVVGFDAGMREVNTMMGMSSGELKGFSAQVANMASTLGVDAVASTKALYQAISAGVPQENAITFLEVATKAAIGGVTDTETAVDGLSTVINAFGMKAADAESVADTMFATVRSGKTTFSELASSMSTVAPIASAAGVSFSEISAMTATLTKQGVPTAGAMTQIRAAVQGLLKPSEAMSGIFGKLGFESAAAAIKSEGLGFALGAVREATGGDIGAMTTLLGSIEGVGAALGVTGANADMFAADMASMNGAAGASGAAFDEMNQSATRAWDQLKNGMQGIVVSLGSELLPAITPVISAIAQGLPGAFAAAKDAIGPVIGKIGEIGDVLGGLLSGDVGLGGIPAAFEAIAGIDLPDNIEAFFVGLEAAVDGLSGPLATLTDTMAQAFGGLGIVIQEAISGDIQGALSTLGEVVSSALMNIFGDELGGKLSAGITSMIDGAMAAFGRISTALEGVFAGVMQALGPIIDNLGTIWGTIVEQAAPVLSQLGGLFGALGPYIEAVAVVVGGVLVAAFGVLMGVLGGVVGFIGGALPGVFQALGGVIQTLTGVFQVISSVILGVVNVVGAALKGDWAGAWTAAQEMVQGVATGIGNIIGGLADVVVGLISGMIGGVLGAIRGFVDSIVGYFTGLYQTLVGGSIVPELVGAIQGLWQGMIDAVKAATEAFKSAIVGIWNALKTASETIWNELSGLLQGIWQGMKDAGESTFNLFKAAVSGIWNAMKTAGETIWNEVSGILTGIWESMKAAGETTFNLFKDALAGIWEAIKTTADTVWNGISGTVTGIWTGMKTAGETTFGAIRDGIKGVWDSIHTTAQSSWDGIVDTIKSAVNAIIGAVNSFISAWNGLHFSIPGFSVQVPFGPLIEWGGFDFGVGQIGLIPSLARGGIFNRATTAILGEAGPEAVIPLSKLVGIFGSTIGQVVTSVRRILGGGGLPSATTASSMGIGGANPAVLGQVGGGGLVVPMPGNALVGPALVTNVIAGLTQMVQTIAGVFTGAALGNAPSGVSGSPLPGQGPGSKTGTGGLPGTGGGIVPGGGVSGPGTQGGGHGRTLRGNWMDAFEQFWHIDMGAGVDMGSYWDAHPEVFETPGSAAWSRAMRANLPEGPTPWLWGGDAGLPLTTGAGGDDDRREAPAGYAWRGPELQRVSELHGVGVNKALDRERSGQSSQPVTVQIIVQGNVIGEKDFAERIAPHVRRALLDTGDRVPSLWGGRA